MNSDERALSRDLGWLKSSYSGGEGGNCIEVAASPVAVHVRDSKDKCGPQLAFTSAEWAAFVAYVTELPEVR